MATTTRSSNTRLGSLLDAVIIRRLVRFSGEHFASIQLEDGTQYHNDLACDVAEYEPRASTCTIGEVPTGQKLRMEYDGGWPTEITIIRDDAIADADDERRRAKEPNGALVIEKKGTMPKEIRVSRESDRRWRGSGARNL